MIKFSIFFLLTFSSFVLYSKPYYSEYIENQQDKQFIVIFHGNISNENEPKVKMLEQKYLEYEDGDFLEYKHMRLPLEKELNALGISVEVIENTDLKRSDKIPHPPEFHNMPSDTN